MAVKSIEHDVTTTVARIPHPDGGHSDAPAGVMVHNLGASTVYIGGPDVTTANGYPIGAGEEVTVNLISGEIIYAIVASGTVSTRVLTTRN